ncbi:MAG: XRE family transcriptional regulator [Pseudonocardiales bacterium]|nr:XRE family transcriptional regulator [Pseudonocardiales bacterium]
MAAVNDQLRAARQRTASLTYPDECLSRQELAELVNSWVWEHHRTRVEASANYIGQLERGKIRWPGKLYREALRAIFSVSTDSALGFVNARSRRTVVKLDNVKRRQLFETGALGMGTLALDGPMAALLEGSSEPTPIPHRIGVTEIEQTRSATQVFVSWSGTYGGGLARETVMAQLRYSAGLLEATCPARLRPELFSAVGYLADVAGFMAVDANAHEEGRRVYRFALACAEQAKNWNLRAEVLSSMAKQAIWTGQPDEGLTLAGQGLIRPDRLTAIGRSLLHTDRARALAKMRRTSETLTAVGTADDHFAHATPADESPYMPYYSDARHAQLTGQALFDLAILGRDHGKATDQLAVAVAGQPHDALSQAICLAKLASLAMVTGDPLQAAALGHAAMNAAGTIRSHRATEELRELARYAAAHQNLDEVAHLRQRIYTLVRTYSP